MEAFKLGGPGMIPTTIFGLILVAAAVLYARRPDRRYVPLLISLNVLTLTSGGLGFAIGMIKTLGGASGGAAGEAGLIAMAGLGESLYNMALAFALMVLGGLVAAVGAARIAASRAPTSA
jgi:hypothetical protein